jgi:hypothetical protein
LCAFYLDETDLSMTARYGGRESLEAKAAA